MDHSQKYDTPWDLLTDSFTGSLSPEDEQKFNTWLSSDPGNREKYDRFRELWEEGLEDYRFYQQADETKAWMKLSAGMKSNETILHSTLFRNKNTHFLRNLSGLAAGFLLLMSIGYLVFFRDNTIVYKTASAEHREIRLMDGSEIVLKPQTKIKVAQDFNKSGRIISMEQGEAAFTVRHQADPFIVKAGPVSIQDLGTSFIVSKDKEKVNVAVSSGKVAFIINATHETRELTAGESITFNINEKHSGEDVNIKTGQIVENSFLNFDNTPLSEVIASVQKKYGNKIGIADSATGNKRLTADFDGVPIENVIAIICKSLNLEYSLKDSTYLLIEKRR